MNRKRALKILGAGTDTDIRELKKRLADVLYNGDHTGQEGF